MGNETLVLGSTSVPQTGLWKWWRSTVDAVAILLVSAVLGATLVFVAAGFGPYGPLVLISAAIIPIASFLVLHDVRIGLFMVFATFPFSTLISTVGPLPLQPVELVVPMVVTVIVIVRAAQKKAPLGWHPVLAWAIALIGWAIVAMPSAADRSLALKQLLSLVAALVLAAAIIGACEKISDVRWIVTGLVAVAAAAAAFALITGGPPKSVYGATVVADRLSGPFNQPNQLGSFAAMMSLVAAGVGLAARTTAGRMAAGSAVALLLGALALSLSRGAWIGAAAGFLVLFVSLRSARRAAFTLAIPLIGFGILFTTASPDAPQVQIVGARLEVLTTQSPYDDRSDIWAEARRQVSDDPWTGQGPGNFSIASTEIASEAGTVYADHAHNLFLNWAAETGVPGAAMIGGLIVAVALTIRHVLGGTRTRSEDATIVAGLGAALVSVLVHGMVDYPLGNQVLWFLVWTLIALVLAAHRVLRR